MQKDTIADMPARKAIIERLDANLVVEAAAGTGKTTSLVGRMMAVVARDKSPENMAAITFTRKAAAELRDRFRSRFEQARRENAEWLPSVSGVDECFIGTIHSFCARLLRERPLEAGVDPSFSELEEEADRTLRDEAWDAFAAGLHGDSELATSFEEFDLGVAELREGFHRYCQYPDVGEWPGGDVSVVSFAGMPEKIHEYLRPYSGLRAAMENAEPGSDTLISLIRRLWRRLDRAGDMVRARDVAFVLDVCTKNVKVTQRSWHILGMAKQDAKELAARYARFYDEAIAPFRRDWLAARYGVCLRAYRKAGAEYNRLRGPARLNFQDLLMAATKMLRDNPDVRRHFSARFTRILVDEFQDTDPIQAELLFFLASADENEKDWRKCSLRPGSLFIVGDPKQSIYRFRRADIAIYSEVKKLITTQGGAALELSVNFRSRPEVIDWINGTFASDPSGGDAVSRFPYEADDYNPAYVSLACGRPQPAEGAFSGVFRLPIDTSLSAAEAKEDEARRVARFIRGALDQGLSIVVDGSLRPVRPEDFLIVSWRKTVLSGFARALRSLDVPCRVSGGGIMSETPALLLLSQCLRALVEPDNPVALVAVLRGELFGIGDDDLFAWRRAGGSFHFLSRQPSGGGERMTGAMRRMGRYYSWLQSRTPHAAIRAIAEDLGLWQATALGAGGEFAAGAVAAALDILRDNAAYDPTPAQALERLESAMADDKLDPPSVFGRGRGAVRLMNLHKTKGLEAPIVFLVFPFSKHMTRVDSHVERLDGVARGRMVVRDGDPVIARSGDWEDVEAIETLNLEAERLRLRYVAATRAGCALVISATAKKGYVWNEFVPRLSDCPELPELAVAIHEPDPQPPQVAEMSALAASRQEREAVVRKPTYRVRQAKAAAQEFAVAPKSWEINLEDGGGELEFDVEQAAAWGTALHSLLEKGEGHSPEDLETSARQTLLENGLDPALVAQAVETVRAALVSPLWQRAKSSARILKEAPFTLWLSEKGLLLRGMVDLAFDEDGWVLVDYKSDRLGGRTGAEVARRHAPQLWLYAEAWRRATGEKVKETGILLLRTGEYVELPDLTGEGAKLLGAL